MNASSAYSDLPALQLKELQAISLKEHTWMLISGLFSPAFACFGPDHCGSLEEMMEKAQLTELLL